MNDRRAISFLAHAMVVGKANLSADEQGTLKKLAGRWPQTGTAVQRRSDADIPADVGFPGGATVPEFTGTIASVDHDADTVTVTLDAPIPVNAGWTTADATEVTVPATWIEPIPPAPAPVP